MPKILVKVATILPASCRKRCSTTWEISAGGGATSMTSALLTGCALGCRYFSSDCVSKHAILAQSLSHGTIRGDRAHLDFAAVFQCRTIFGNGNCLVESGHLEQKISANGLFGFRERAIGYDTSFLTRYNFTSGIQLLGSLELALIGDPFKPRLHMIHG